MFFQKKLLSFDRETIGQQLRTAREQKGLTIKAISKKLIIKADYLEALESGQHSKLPKGVYVKNYLKEYARFLGLDYRSLDEQFLNENKTIKKLGGVFERQVVAKKYLIAVPIIVRNLLIGIIALFCLIYLGVLINKIFQAPFLIIDQPSSDMATTERQLIINGRTEPESDVTVNNQAVEVANNGSFKKEVYLEQGLNTITITSKKKNSRTALVVRRILFQEQTPLINSVN
jgi:cytoskeletal protein RodZ